MMKRLFLTAVVVLAAFSLTGLATAAKPPNVPANAKGSALLCFSGTTDGGYGGTCKTTKKKAVSAVLDTTDGNPSGSYAGVYFAAGLPAKVIGKVTALSFSYNCPSADPCVGGGSPRWSIPIDSEGTHATDAYAFIDAQNCGQGGDTSGTVDLSCPVFYGSDEYSDWASFASANPTYRIGDDAVPFVIADQPFLGTISNVVMSEGAGK